LLISEDQKNKKTSSRFLLLLKIAITTGLIIAIFNNTDFNKTLVYFYNFNFKYVVLALFVLALQTIIATVRWNTVLQSLDININRLKLLEYMWIGLFFNQVLPSSIGGDAVKGYYLFKDGFGIKKSFFGVMLDRLIGMIGLLVLILLSMPVLFDIVDEAQLKWTILLVVLGLFSLIIFILIVDILPNRLMHWKFMRELRQLSFTGRSVLLKSKSRFFLIITSIIIHLLSIIVFIILSVGMGINVGWLDIYILIPLTTLFMALPISIAGWGVREGIIIVGLGYAGISPEGALAISVIYGLSMLAITLPGLVAWTMLGKTDSKNMLRRYEIIKKKAKY
jgi:uncharacterized protein (TIRG00374 family)